MTSDDGSASSGDIDRLVDRALQALRTFAHRGSTLTTGVALMALFVVGLTYLVGLQAFDGGARTVWLGLGAVMLVAAVGAPLLASFRLRSIPKHSTELATELRALLRNDEARRVVIETVAADEGEVPPMPSGRPVPAVVFQSQNYTRLRSMTDAKEGFTRLAWAFHNLASLPGLLIVSMILTGISAFLGFVFFLIWVF